MRRVRIIRNYIGAKLHRAHPCGVCGYAYECGDPPGEDCHS